MLQGVFAILSAIGPHGSDSLPHMDTAYVSATRVTFSAVGRFQRTWEGGNNAGQSVAGLLAQNGVFIKQYGVSGVALLSRRGADPQQTQLLWNGLPAANTMLGMQDLNTMFVFGGTKISITEGGNASVYGSGNVGGTLQLTHGKPLKNGFNVANVFSAGSFGQYSNALDLGFVAKSFWVRSQTLLSEAENNFPYEDARNYTLERVKMQNAQAKFFTQRIIAGATLGKWQLKTVGEISSANRNLGLALGSTVFQGNQKDYDKRFMLEAACRWNRIQCINRVGIISDRIIFSDTGKYEIDSSLATIKHLQTEWYFNIKKSRIMTGADAQIQQGLANTYHGLKNRNYTGQFLNAIIPYQKWIINPGVRFEWFEKIPVWSLTVEREINTVLRVSANVHRTFRRPTLNDLFWEIDNTKALKNEYGYGSELNIKFARQKRKILFYANVSVYERRLNNPIIWVSTGSVWRAQNLYRGDFAGAQWNGGCKFQIGKNSFHAISNYDLVFSQMYYYPESDAKQRIFIPKHSGNISLQWERGTWYAGSNLVYTGMRYTTTDNSEYLNGFFLLSANAGKQIFKTKKWAGLLQLESNNITSTTYVNMPGRPMPGRSFMLTLKINNQ